MQQRFRTGGLASWSIRRPVSVLMLTLTVIVLGFFSLGKLGIDLLPHIIYPEVRVRIMEPGIPASVMENRITRQLEEQLAITEGVIRVQSTTTEGRSSVNLSFPYAKAVPASTEPSDFYQIQYFRLLYISETPPKLPC